MKPCAVGPCLDGSLRSAIDAPLDIKNPHFRLTFTFDISESFLLVPVSLPHTMTDFVEWSNKYALQAVQYMLNYEHMLLSCARIKLKIWI